MVPQKIKPTEDVRTVELPAQEMLDLPVDQFPVLTAEQAYTQRYVETPQNADMLTHGFIP